MAASGGGGTVFGLRNRGGFVVLVWCPAEQAGEEPAPLPALRAAAVSFNDYGHFTARRGSLQKRCPPRRHPAPQTLAGPTRALPREPDSDSPSLTLWGGIGLQYRLVLKQKCMDSSRRN